jgi:hypothetical protein
MWVGRHAVIKEQGHQENIQKAVWVSLALYCTQGACVVGIFTWLGQDNVQQPVPTELYSEYQS